VTVHNIQEGEIMTQPMLFEFMPCKFSNEDKAACLPLIEKMTTISKKGKSEGVLSLDENDYAIAEGDSFLRMLLCMYVSGIVDMNQILINALLADRPTDKRLLECLIMLEGIGLCAESTRHYDVKLRLASLLGSKYVLAMSIFNHDNPDKTIEKFLAATQYKQAVSNIKFDEYLMKSTAYDIANLIKNFNAQDIISIFFVSSGNAIKKFISNVSLAVSVLLVHEYNHANFKYFGGHYINRAIRLQNTLIPAEGNVLPFQRI
jgi:hypothetical protein